MNTKKSYILVAILGAVFLGFLNREGIKELLFDKDRFVDCFHSELIALIQGEAILRGNTTLAMSAERMLGNQVYSIARNILASIGKIGVSAEREQLLDVTEN